MNDCIIEGVFPLEKNNNMKNDDNEEKYIYFDNYFDNKITFEDLIIYGYTQENIIDILKELFGRGLFFTQFGNGKNEKTINNNPETNNFVLIGEYKNSGTVNNTQFQICDLNFTKDQDNDNLIGNQNSYRYFIIKFVQLETDTRWWYAPGPVIIKLPKNIMYPFKIGGSRYKR